MIACLYQTKQGLCDSSESSDSEHTQTHTQMQSGPMATAQIYQLIALQHNTEDIYY